MWARRGRAASPSIPSSTTTTSSKRSWPICWQGNNVELVRLRHAIVSIAYVARGAARAWARPTVGAPPRRVEADAGAAGRMRPLPATHPVLVVYEDKDAQTQNERARALLGQIADRAENRAKLEFVAV